MPSLAQELADVGVRNKPLATNLEGGEFTLRDPPQYGLRGFAEAIRGLANCPQAFGLILSAGHGHSFSLGF